MTPDLDEIRAALAAATPGPWDQVVDNADGDLIANAPTWLAALCSEVDRLRVEVSREPDHSVGYTLKLVAERDAALAEVERLRGIDDTIDRLIAEGDAWRACADQLAADMRGIGDTMALAAYERLKGADS